MVSDFLKSIYVFVFGLYVAANEVAILTFFEIDFDHTFLIVVAVGVIADSFKANFLKKIIKKTKALVKVENFFGVYGKRKLTDGCGSHGCTY